MHAKVTFSKLGYVLAMAGSAVGLGTAWKFPTMTGNNGGFAFIFLYIVLAFAIGAAAFLAEGVVGKLTGKDARGGLIELAPRAKKGWGLGGLFTAVGILIVPFYLVVIGWIFYYAFSCIWGLPASSDEATKLFTNLIFEDLQSVCISFLVVFALAFFTISRGIKNGIEKLNLFLMPALFVLLLILVAYSAFNGNFSGAVSFIFTPDFSKILDPDLLLKALGLVMFSTSLGMCTICTYAASTSSDTNLFNSVFYIILLNIAVGILMGLIVFSFLPTENAAEGPGLIFISLASLFGSLGAIGQVIGFAFFAALIFAGVTSAVSIIEPTVLYLHNNLGISRKKAVSVTAIFVLIVGFICIFSYYKPSADALTFFGKSVFDLLDFTTSNILMPLGALFFAIFTGWVAPRDRVCSVFSGFVSKGVIAAWYYILRFLVPLAIIGVGVYNLIN